MPTIDPSSIEALADLIAGTQHAEVVHVESVSVVETFRGETVWEGVVEAFASPDRPDLPCWYAWHEPGGKSWVVHHAPPVDSPLEAVRASIVGRA